MIRITSARIQAAPPRQPGFWGGESHTQKAQPSHKTKGHGGTADKLENAGKHGDEAVAHGLNAVSQDKDQHQEGIKR